jgi:YVTN family beta-propeller protein
MYDVRRSAQQRHVSLDDHAVKTVVYKNQEAFKELREGFHRSPPQMFWSDNQNHLSWRPVESTAPLCFAILSPLGFQGRSPWLSLVTQMSGPLLAISRTEIDRITILELDGEMERELATIRVRGKQPFGLAFDEMGRYLYAACWTSGKIGAINLGSLKEEKSLSAARLPAWATRRPGTNEIWISNEGAGVVTVLDTHAWSVSCQIATGGGPSDIAFTDHGRHAWVTNEKDENVSLIDAQSRHKITDIRVGKVPQGIAVAQNERRLLVVNFGSNSISVIDTAARQELAQISVGSGPVDVVTLSREGLEHAWVTCFTGGAVSVIALERREEIQRIVTGGKPQGLETHPSGERIYAAVRGLNELIVLNSVMPCTVLRRIKMPGGPARMAVAPATDAHKDIPFR